MVTEKIKDYTDKAYEKIKKDHIFHVCYIERS